MNITWVIGMLAVGMVGCSPDWSDRVPQPKPRGEVRLEPAPVTGVSSRSVGIRSSVGQTPRLFALALSESQVGSVRRGDPSETVSEHEVPLIERPSADRSTESAELSGWQPVGLLAAATSHTVVTADVALKFITAANEPALLRVWPPDSAPGRAVFCAESSAGLRAIGANPEQLWGDDRVWFLHADAGGAPVEVGSATREWTLLAGESACWLWVGQDNAVAPAHFNGFAVEPTIVASEPRRTTSDAASSPSTEAAAQTLDVCGTDLVSTAGGCVATLDDRIIVRPTVTDTLWLISGEAEGWFVSEQGDPGVIRGMRANTQYALHLTVFEPTGGSVESDLVVRTAEADVHVVINEVFADPLGSEPQGEWVELYNDSANIVDLEGWALEDDGGRAELPKVQLAPFGYALLVNDTYERTAELDVVPDEDVFLIRLPSLGKSGLSNQGESLRLVDNSGMLVSSFPASPKPAPGKSVARREPWFVGSQVRGFGLHAAPFASPGTRNLLGTEN